MIRDVLEALVAGRDLSGEAMEECFQTLMEGGLGEAQQAAFLVSLRVKGETPEEVAAAARVLRRVMVPVDSGRSPLVDTCGTGGDGAHTLNISTGAALLAAACGAGVAKHGNRSVSSMCGSADVLEALGVPLTLEPDRLAALLDGHGFAFLFAPALHPAMKAVMPVRRALGLRTIFNLLGPLCNPAGATRQVVGVYAPSVLPLMAGALAALGSEHAWVVHSHDGLDELSVCAPSRVLEVRDGVVVREIEVRPDALGLGVARAEDLTGGDAEENARRLRRILTGEERSAAADAVALNAAAALVVTDRSVNLETALAECQEGLAAGIGAAKLDDVVAVAGGWT